MTSTGIAAPPEMQTRSEPASPSSWSSAVNMVGTPSNTVTASRSRIASALAASKRGSNVSVPPAASVALSAQVWPKAWKKGNAPSVTAVSSMPKSAPLTSWLRIRFACVSCAPFGVPVVPEV